MADGFWLKAFKTSKNRCDLKADEMTPHVRKELTTLLKKAEQTAKVFFWGPGPVLGDARRYFR